MSKTRLKVGVMTQNKTIQELGAYYNQLAVQLSEDAFSELPIKFNPDMENDVREKYLDELKRKLPYSNIYEI